MYVFDNRIYTVIETLYSTDTHFHASTLDSFSNIVGKGEIARNAELEDSKIGI